MVVTLLQRWPPVGLSGHSGAGPAVGAIAAWVPVALPARSKWLVVVRARPVPPAPVWTVVLTVAPWRSYTVALVAAMQAPTMPTSYLIDRRGVVRFRHEGFHGPATIASYIQQIEQLLNERSEPSPW